MAASAVLLQGKQLSASEAHAMGIFHAAVPGDQLITEAKKWIKANPKAKQPWDMDVSSFQGERLIQRKAIKCLQVQMQWLVKRVSEITRL